MLKYDLLGQTIILRMPQSDTMICGIPQIRLDRFVLGGGENTPLKQILHDLPGTAPRLGQLKDQPHIVGGLAVRLHPTVRPLAVAVGTLDALILAPAELHILGAFVLHGQVPAVEFADEVFECHVHPACVPMMIVAVELIPQGDESDVVQREHHLHKVPHFNGVAPEPGEVFHDDTIHAPGPHQLKQLLDGGPLEVGPAVAVVHEL